MVGPDNSGNVPPSLLHPDLVQLWKAMRQRLDKFGTERRGKISTPAISLDAKLALESLLGRKPTARLDVALLEEALIAQGISNNLDDALTRLGAPPSTSRAASRAATERREQVRGQIQSAISSWPEQWTPKWLDWLFRSGQFAGAEIDQAYATVLQVRRILDELQNNDMHNLARNELAARLCGSSHALDDGLLLERCARRALWHQTNMQTEPSQAREVWAEAGVNTDRVSAPVLAWQLPLEPASPLGKLSSAAKNAGIPLHLTQFALRKHPPVFQLSTPILLVENPRIVEAAAERNWPGCVIATNGNPSTAVNLLVDALLLQKIPVHHHGDFDSAGIGICRRMMKRGCTPWKMTAVDYREAIGFAHEQGLKLPTDNASCGVTPWDPELESCFGELKAVVHEELLIEGLLGVSWSDPNSLARMVLPE